MSGSGEHALELEAAKTDPCPAPSDWPEADRTTWPRIPSAPPIRHDLTTDVLDSEERID